jgi:SAM-dependent methyltransferase
VDRLILSRLAGRGGDLLDVGSGDGGRAVRLAQAALMTQVVLSDPSEPMVALCRQHQASQVWHTAAEDLLDGPLRFDVVTCLWNVLGSVDGTERRVAALERMRALLAPGGRLFLDVHNRYNARTAGPFRVFARMVRDGVSASEANGSVAFTWTVEGARIPSRGYLFTPGEMPRLLTRAGLLVANRWFVDYDTGAVRGRWGGQMLFELERDRR